MKSKLIAIGHSRGVRLPKAVIEQADLHDDLEIRVVDKSVVISASKQVREGWAAEAAACSDSTADIASDWDGVVGDGLGERS